MNLQKGHVKVKKWATAVLSIFLLLPPVALAGEEGTRHITAQGKDIYFMSDKVFGTIDNHPLWAIYDCGAEINGQIDIRGNYYNFNFQYQREGVRIVKGFFGPLEMSLGQLEKKGHKIIYRVFADKKEYLFSVRYERIEDSHMVNSIIEGEIGNGNVIKLTVDGHLCPFATTGIVLIIVGSFLLS